jgi:hypothetical protein
LFASLQPARFAYNTFPFSGEPSKLEAVGHFHLTVKKKAECTSEFSSQPSNKFVQPDRTLASTDQPITIIRLWECVVCKPTARALCVQYTPFFRCSTSDDDSVCFASLQPVRFVYKHLPIPVSTLTEIASPSAPLHP